MRTEDAGALGDLPSDLFAGSADVSRAEFLSLGSPLGRLMRVDHYSNTRRRKFRMAALQVNVNWNGCA